MPCQELGQLMRGGLRVLYVEEVADALDGAFLDVRERKRRKPAASIQRGAVSAPVTDSTAWRSVAPARRQSPLGQCRQRDSEEGVGICERAFYGAGNSLYYDANEALGPNG